MKLYWHTLFPVPLPTGGWHSAACLMVQSIISIRALSCLSVSAEKKKKDNQKELTYLFFLYATYKYYITISSACYRIWPNVLKKIPLLYHRKDAKKLNYPEQHKSVYHWSTIWPKKYEHRYKGKKSTILTATTSFYIMFMCKKIKLFTKIFSYVLILKTNGVSIIYFQNCLDKKTTIYLLLH